MNLTPTFIREEIIKAVRRYFYDLKFHEVFTPTLNTTIPLEPNIYPFQTVWKTVHGEKKFYLSTSPEAGLKKMIGKGIGNCFAISKCFRNLEDASDRHIPEFLMLEWYRSDATYIDIMNEVTRLVRYIKKEIDTYLGREYDNQFDKEWSTHSMTDLFAEYASLDFNKILDDNEMYTAAKKKEYDIRNATWEQLFNQIFLNEIEPHLGNDPCFVTDFPARTSPLCKPKDTNHQLAERFELYIAGMEIGNGNTENTNTETIEQLFQRQEQERKEKGIVASPLDTQFIEALASMKNTSVAGIGVGIDRLAMILAEVKSIQEVELLF